MHGLQNPKIVVWLPKILSCDIHGYIYFVLGCYKIIRPCILKLHYNFSTAVLGSHTHCHLQRGRRGVAEHGLVGPFPFLIHLLITAIFPLANTSPFARMMTFTNHGVCHVSFPYTRQYLPDVMNSHNYRTHCLYLCLDTA